MFGVKLNVIYSILLQDVNLPLSSNLLALPNQFQKRIAVEFQNVLSQVESIAKSLFENNWLS